MNRFLMNRFLRLALYLASRVKFPRVRKDPREEGLRLTLQSDTYEARASSRL